MSYYAENVALQIPGTLMAGKTAATDAHLQVPGCSAYKYDLAKRQVTAGSIYFDVGTLLRQIGAA